MGGYGGEEVATRYNHKCFIVIIFIAFMSLYYEKEGVKLFHGDCLDILKEIQTNSVDLIFADPPYFLSNGGITCKAGKMVLVNKADWDKSKGFENDFNFNRKWINLCREVLKDNGCIWVSGTMHNIYQIGFSLQSSNFHLLNEISWFKPNAPPNLSCKYFAHSHETVLWARKSKNNSHKFNYDEMKNIDDRISPKGRQMRSVWNIPLTPKWEKIYGRHPTQKPLELIRRIILSNSMRGDLVLDPFSGSGTTGVMAKKLGRNYLGIDIEKDYLDLSIKRIEAV
jgi:site-specific DNA-methyltransferase (adenine-specific)